MLNVVIGNVAVTVELAALEGEAHHVCRDTGPGVQHVLGANDGVALQKVEDRQLVVRHPDGDLQVEGVAGLAGQRQTSTDHCLARRKLSSATAGSRCDYSTILLD